MIAVDVGAISPEAIKGGNLAPGFVPLSTASLTLSPADGPVGSTVTANGTGFVANTAIAFRVGGASVLSRCETDPNGTFPGSSGTPCTFVVPTAPAGSVNVTAVGSNLSTIHVTVGSTPYGVAYDSATDQMFVANYNNGTVSVVSDVNDTVAATIPVGVNPYAVAYDNRTGQVFVSDFDAVSGTGALSVIADNGTNADTVVATVTLSNGPVGVAYDWSRGEVFVANTYSASVDVVSETNDSIVSMIHEQSSSGGSGPNAVAYDPGTGEIFVANSGENNVSVISDATNQVIASIPVGSFPVGVAYDASQGELFVANENSDNVTVINDSNDASVASVTVGTSPTGIAFDSLTNDVFVANSGNNSVSVLSALTNSVVSTMPVGDSPFGIAFGNHTNQVFLTNSASNTLTRISVVSPVNATRVFVVVAGLTLSSVRGPAGSTVLASGTGFSPTSIIDLTFGGSAVLSTCTTDASGVFPGTTGTPCSFAVPPVAHGTYVVSANNGSSTANASYTVDVILLSADNATVGSTVSVTGMGFPADSIMTFTVGKVFAPTQCRTDANGTFPGTSGTSCDFRVPAVPGGVENVSEDPVLFANNSIVGVGLQPIGEAYDSGTGQVFTANSNDNTVSVISDATDRVVATVPVGTYPYWAAYDPRTSEVYVTNIGGNSVSIISDVSDTVVATLQVGNFPAGLTYDVGRGEMFVTNAVDGTVSVISDHGSTAGTVVATVTVGNLPAAAAYDPNTGEVWIANNQGNDLSVINDSTDNVVATIPVGVNPVALTCVETAGQVFVSNNNDNTVSVISDTTDAVIATAPVGGGPSGIVSDPETGQVFVANEYTDNLTAISVATDTSVGSVQAGNASIGVVLDSETGQLFVTNENDSTVDVIGGVSVGEPFGTASFSVDPSVLLSSPSGTVDVGQPVALNAFGFGSALSITTFSLGSQPLACLNATIGTCTTGSLGTDTSGVVAAMFVVPVVSVSESYNVTLADTAGNQAGSNLSVFADPSVGSVAVAPSTIDLGQSAMFSISTIAGSGGDTFVWYGLPQGCHSTGASFSCIPTAAGVFSIAVNVTDSNGFTVISGATSYTVYPDPVVTEPVATVGSGMVDEGQTVTFNVSGREGTGAYPSYAWFGLPAGCSGTTDTVTCSGSDLSWGSYSIFVTVTDSNGVTSIASPTLAFTVNQDPTAATPSVNRPSSDVGQTVTFSTSATLGGGAYKFAWSGLPTGCAGSGSVVECASSGPGTFGVTVNVTDSDGFTTQSGTLTFTVYSSPTANLSASRTAFDAGQSVILTATASSGFGAYTYAWSGLPAGCRPAGASATCSFPDSGSDSIRVTVTDSNGVSIDSSAIVLHVNVPVAAGVSETVNETNIGKAVTFTSSATGGTGALNYTWEFGDGSTGTGATVDHAYSAAGTYTVTLWVNDTTGGSIEKTLSLTVLGSSSGTAASGGLGSLGEILAIVAAVVVLGAIAAALLLRRRGGRAPSDTDSEGTASDDEPPDQSADGADHGTDADSDAQTD